jgi:hypothetical protein
LEKHTHREGSQELARPERDSASKIRKSLEAHSETWATQWHPVLKNQKREKRY